MRACSRRRRAASAVELALLLPILVALFVFAIDFARLYYAYCIVTNCARNGALYASGSPQDIAESHYLDLNAAALADASNLNPIPTVSVYPTDYYLSTVASVQVTVTYPFSTISNYPGLPNPINLTRTIQMNRAPTVPN